MSGLVTEESLSMSDDCENWVPVEESLNMYDDCEKWKNQCGGYQPKRYVLVK